MRQRVHVYSPFKHVIYGERRVVQLRQQVLGITEVCVVDSRYRLQRTMMATFAS